jgi:general secretion pathway protein G
MARFQIQRRGRSGFTLMEVLLVLAILVILGATAVGIFSGVQASANVKTAQFQVENIDQASERYNAVVGEYPMALTDLTQMPAHLTQSKWGGPHLEDLPADPWGNPYEYVYPGQQNAHLGKPDVWSWGPDRQSGTEDDIGNWPAAVQ